MNLDALTVEVLTELTNAGTVRRALKDGLPNPRGAATVIEQYVEACLSSQPA